MEIQKDVQNKLLGRREVSFIVEAEKTPSSIDASKMASEQFKTAEDSIMVEKVQGKFGVKTFLVKASIYDSKEMKEAALKRLTKQKKEKTEGAPAK